jgi:hypothetical protein
VISNLFICILFISVPLAVVALILGIAGVSAGKPTGGATARIVLSLIVMLLSTLVLAGLLSSAAVRGNSPQT